MDHVRFCAKRDNDRKKLLRERRGNRRRFKQLVDRGYEISELVPKEEERHSVLVPGRLF